MLNRVAAGEEFEITRNGATVAELRRARARLVSAERFREMMSSAPRPDPDFLSDLREIREESGPIEDVWQS